MSFSDPLTDGAVSPPAPQPPRKRPRTEKSRVGAAYPRKRAAAACRLCRARKVKCNNARPACSSCSDSASTCVYEDPNDHSAFDPASILILDRLNQVLTRLDQAPGFLAAPLVEPVPSPTTIPHDPSASATGNGYADYDQLRIPSEQTTADSVLQWPIFGNRYPPNFLTDPVFESELAGDSHENEEPQIVRTAKRSRAGGIDEDAIPELIQRFLKFAHIKNPVLDIESVLSCARQVSEEGIKWDAMSCMVLIACALGCVAQPFEHQNSSSPETSLESDAEALQEGEVYYGLARKRLGFLQEGTMAAQCYFLAGVYLMYTMRPLTAWSQFHSASRSYHVYLELQSRRRARAGEIPSSSKRRRLEQSLYWSCYKSECELRTEINLPHSSLADFQNPDLHPSPPVTGDTSPAGADTTGVGQPSESPGRNFDAQQQENSWYYYLTEITLRRISNRVINTLYADKYQFWTVDQIPYMVRAASEYEQQLEEWYTGLPEPLRYSDTEIPSDELPCMVRGRVYTIRLSLYQPFLYHAIHSLGNDPAWNIVLPLAEKALTYGFCMVQSAPGRHRHHGTWLGIRTTVAALLFIFAAVRCDAILVRPDWKDVATSCIDRLGYWKDEAPGVSQAIEMLESYL